MSLRRVVVTGLGAVSPFGVGVTPLMDALLRGRHGISFLPELEEIKGLRCHVAGRVPELDVSHVERKYRRFMSRMSVFTLLACQEALAQAAVPPELLHSGRLGVAVGATLGSPQTTQEFYQDFLQDHSIERTKSHIFFKVMGHTCAANAAQALGVTGRVLAPAAACASAGQAIGLGWEMIALGRQDAMLCGGAEELHPLTVSTFDILGAASTNYNDAPHKTPRPFDRERDGTVCSEGAGVLLLEGLDTALERGATPLAEVAGFACSNDARNISSPDAASIEACMRLALESAGLAPQDVDCVNAHATATELGDIAEGRAIERLFGSETPVTCCKGNLGHSLAASGGLESAVCVRMLEQGNIPPLRNLENVDPRCGKLHHVREPLSKQAGELGCIIKNNFALGGVNTSLVFTNVSGRAGRNGNG